MEYAAKKRQRGAKASRPRQTGAAVQQAGRLHGRNGADKGCSADGKRTETFGSHQPVADGFLTSRFLPKLSGSTVEIGRATDSDFNRSLSQLCLYHQIQQPCCDSGDAAYDMAYLFGQAEKLLSERLANFSGLQLLENGNGTISLSSEQRYSVGTVLYYIPVMPLVQMLADRKKHRCGVLLLSVFAYLYHVVDIPYYRSEDSYIHWQYEMIADMAYESDESEELVRELGQAKFAGDRIEKKIYNAGNLDFFGERIAGFSPADQIETECLQIAKAAYELYTAYPNARIFQNASPLSQADEDEEICMDKYISFIASSRGTLYYSMTEYVNCELNEYGSMQEPAIANNFNGGSPQSGDLDFEQQIFPFIEQLCCVLGDYADLFKQ